jgi:hypothetical protein
MNSACDNEERTDYDHESHVIDSRVSDPRGLLNNEEIIETNYGGESNAKLVVMTLPMMLSDERCECDRHQQDDKRQHDRPVRARRDETQDPSHLAIGLIAVRSVNETRPCGACFEEWFEDAGRASVIFRMPAQLAGARRLRSRQFAGTYRAA